MKNKLYFILSFAMFLMALESLAGTIWDAGGNANTNWSRAQNWNPNGVPASGANVSFGTAGTTATVDSNRSVGLITLNRNANFTINGASNLTINTGITGTVAGRTYTISAPIVFGGNNTWSTTTATTILNITGTVNTAGRNLTVNSSGTTNINSTIVSTGSLTVGGTGTTNINTANEQFRSLTLNSGTLGIDFKTLTVDGNATFNGGTVRISITNPLTYGEIIAGNSTTGNVAIGSGITTLSLNSVGYVANSADKFWLLLNNSNGLTTGWFSGMTQGSSVVLGGQTMYVFNNADFATGSLFGGNDILLTIPEPSTVFLMLVGCSFLLLWRPINKKVLI